MENFRKEESKANKIMNSFYISYSRIYISNNNSLTTVFQIDPN